MMFAPFSLALIIAFTDPTSFPLRNEEQAPLPCYTSTDDSWNANEPEKEQTIDSFLEKTKHDQNQTFSPRKLQASSTPSILQHDPSTFSKASTLIFQGAPPTKHPIERKTIKAVLGYVLGSTALLCGIQAGASLSTYLGFPVLSTATAGVAAALGVIAVAITIHYTWDWVNTWFSD